MGDTCFNRNLKKLFLTPSTRLEMANPYTNPNITQGQLDMRRKAEILKYAGSQPNNAINQITRKQRFSQIVRGFSPQQRGFRTGTGNETTTCPNDETLPTISTNSGIPGNPFMMKLDKSIPLYNFASNTRAFAIINEDNEFPYNVVVYDISNDYYGPNVEVKFGAIRYSNQISTPINTIEITLPYTILEETTQTNGVKTYTTPSSSISVGVDSTLEVLYNDSPIIQMANMVYDVSTPNEIKIKNIKVYSSTGYIYEFRFHAIFADTNGTTNNKIKYDTSAIQIISSSS